jgi:arylsulfatase A-like enzyme
MSLSSSMLYERLQTEPGRRRRPGRAPEPMAVPKERCRLRCRYNDGVSYFDRNIKNLLRITADSPSAS